MSKTNVKINQDRKEFCDKELDLNDLEEGMKHLPVGKTPGLDGLPVEFYQQMRQVVKSLYTIVAEVLGNLIRTN